MIEIEILKMQHQIVSTLWIIAALLLAPINKLSAYMLCGVAIFYAIKGFLV